MIYLVTYSSDILIQYLESKGIDYEYSSNLPIKTKEELESITCRVGNFIVYCSIDLQTIRSIKGNNTFILLESIGKGWKKLIKDKKWIDKLKIDLKEYNKWIEKLNRILTADAYEYFIDKYYNYPSKARLESDVLVMMYKSKLESSQTPDSNKDKRLTQEELRTKYEGISTNLWSYKSNIGSKRGRRILYESSNKDLWLMFIGTDIHPPAILRLVDEYKQQVFSLIKEKVLVHNDNLRECLLLVDLSLELDIKTNSQSTLMFVLSF